MKLLLGNILNPFDFFKMIDYDILDSI